MKGSVSVPVGTSGCVHWFELLGVNCLHCLSRVPLRTSTGPSMFTPGLPLLMGAPPVAVSLGDLCVCVGGGVLMWGAGGRVSDGGRGTEVTDEQWSRCVATSTVVHASQNLAHGTEGSGHCWSPVLRLLQ